MRYDKITSLVWFFFGGFIAIKGWNIGFGSFSNPGAGFIFVLSGILMCLLSVIVFCSAYAKGRRGEEKSISWKGIRWRKMVGFTISLLVFTYFFEKIGYILSFSLLLLYLFKGIEPQKWRIAIICTILSSLFIYIVFVVWLESQFPRGILPF